MISPFDRFFSSRDFISNSAPDILDTFFHPEENDGHESYWFEELRPFLGVSMPYPPTACSREPVMRLKVEAGNDNSELEFPRNWERSTHTNNQWFRDPNDSWGPYLSIEH